jgi:uncharacterized protein YggU (UPF0235/DUF167 family)
MGYRVVFAAQADRDLETIVRFLAEILEVPRGAVQLLRGATSRRKQVRVVGLTGAQLLQRLKPMLERE